MRRVFKPAAALLLLFSGHAMAGDADEILDLLHEFLANAGSKSAHERFWDDDLIYTSSQGTRTDKASIIASFDDAADEDDDGPAPVYSAEDVELRWLGDTVVVAFRLVATPPDETPQLYYFNTGTFVRRDDGWRVVAWQATRIPPQQD